MDIVYGVGLFIAVWVIYGLYSRIDRLEREIRSLRDTSARALQLISEMHDRPEVECEMAKEARKRRRENAAIGLFPDA